MCADKENSKYAIGDLLWAKIGHYPFWPCMVSYDPKNGSYIKKKEVRGVEFDLYHVQYFGNSRQHGWTLPGLILPFEGELAYRFFKRRLLNQAQTPSMRRKILSKYNIPMYIHLIWVRAVREAEIASDYAIYDRYPAFVFKYDVNYKKPSKVTMKKRSLKRKKKKSKAKANKKPLQTLEMYGIGEDLCRICEKGNIDLTCLGDCAQKFHKDCLGLINLPDSFQCNYCERGLHLCFICKTTNDTIFRCNKCNFYYHEECLSNFHCANISKKTCSYHVCLKCHNESNKIVSLKGPFISCIRCPTSFHATSKCIPLGSVKLSATTIICPEHYLGKKKVSPQQFINVSYCGICDLGGELNCCETCPNAYHAACYGTNPPDDFFCDDCQNRQYIYAGMIVLVKTGKCRWWPAQALNFEDLPENIKNVAHCDGEFPVQYYGTDEYFWTHKGRVLPYTERDKTRLTRKSSSDKMDIYYNLSLVEAVDAFDNYVLRKRVSKADAHGHTFKHIRVNRPVPPAIFINSNGNGKQEQNCDCYKKKMTCGPDSNCLNRDMNVECPHSCKLGVRCENQKFQRREYAKIKQFKTENCGWGLKAVQNINEGDFIIEYVGEVITHKEYQRRSVKMQEKGDPNYYFLYLDARRIIDAGPQGNLSRFINHSCDPNCVMSKWSVNGDLRIGIFAIKDISSGEELTFDYKLDSNDFKQSCLCKAKNCQGSIGRNTEKHKAKKLKTK